MKRVIYALCVILGLTMPLIAQTRAYQRPVMAARPYEHTWYDAMMRQFNPDNLDWGQWLEQRREQFLEETAANPYFKYSVVTTLLLVLVSVALTKALIDKSRIKWLAQERYEDALRQDALSRQEAYTAIRRYNEHIEKCNRVVEAELAARCPFTGGVSAAAGHAGSAEALAQAAELRRERDALAAQLENNSATVGELAMRLNGTAAGGKATTGAEGSHSEGPIQGDLVKQIGDLREQLYRERERNKRLKGL